MYKKTFLAMALAVASTASHADMLNLSAEIGYLNPMSATAGEMDVEAENTYFGEIKLEHAIPIIPNVKVDYNTFDTELYNYSLASATAYYQLLDNDVVEVDLGIGATKLSNGEIIFNDTAVSEVFELTGEMAHANISATIHVPFLKGLMIFADAKQLIGEEMRGADYKAGIGYRFDMSAIDLDFKVGVHQSHLEIFEENDDLKLSTQNVMASIGFVF